MIYANMCIYIFTLRLQFEEKLNEIVDKPNPFE